MRKLLAVLLAAPLALAVASPAAAQDHSFSIRACGGQVTFEVLKDNTTFKERESGFQASGNLVVRLSDHDSSIVLRLPGRTRFTFDPETGTSTEKLTGLILLAPFTEAQRAANEDAGLPELALIRGRVVVVEGFGGTRVVSFTPNVTDVCALLDE